MNESFAIRLRRAMDLRRMKATELSSKTGIDRGSISHYLKGSYKPATEKLDKIADALSVDVAWLMGYDVPMTKSSPKGAISDEELKFALFGGEAEITDEQLEEVKRFAKFVKEKNQKNDV